MSSRNRYNWKDVLARIRKAVRNGATRVEWDLESDVVRGMKRSTRDQPSGDET